MSLCDKCIYGNLSEKDTEEIIPVDSGQDCIVGKSGIMRSLLEQVERVARSDATVLLTGESGSGKELIARVIHKTGNRAGGPFIVYNCALFPETPFTGGFCGFSGAGEAVSERENEGIFPEVHRGTIFLDEVGELPISAQTSLLRLLEEQQIAIKCSGELIKHVRIIAATNRDLHKLVEEGKFRSDLLYLLNVFPLSIPPLRRRKSDIPLLADTFIEKYSSITNNKVIRISTPAIDMLMAYHWPGNVRELENCIERAVILADDEVIHSYHLPPSLQTIRDGPPGDRGPLQKQLDILEYELVIEELKRTGGHIKEAAFNLGITYRQFGLRLEKYGIDIKKFKKQGVCNG